MRVQGMRVIMDLQLDGKPITRPGWMYNYAPVITEDRLGYEVAWDVPSQRHPSEFFRISLIGTCLMDANFLWAHLCVLTDDGRPLCWRQPWQCFIQPYDLSRNIPGAVDRITPGLWVGEHSKPETQQQRPLTLLSYVRAVVEP